MSRSRKLLSLVLIAMFFVATVSIDAAEPIGVSPGEAGRAVSVSDTCPTFSWTGVKGARAWDLVVYELGSEMDGVEVELSIPSKPALRVKLPGGAFSWTPDNQRSLESGKRYAWLVRAMLWNGAGKWSEPRLFEIEAMPTVEEVEEALEVLRRYLKLEGAEKGDPGKLESLGTSGAPASIERSRRAPDTNGPEPNNLVLEFSEVAILAEVPAADPLAAPAYAIAGTVELGGDGSAGVYGEIAAAEGVVHGVAGVTQSATDNAAGVSGEALSETGVVHGLAGKIQSATDLAAAVHGVSSSVTGNTRGVRGINASATDGAAGVSGEATASSGRIHGVTGRIQSATDLAAAVHGLSMSALGNTRGVEGINASATDGAAGVSGEATAGSGRIHGVTGRIQSATDLAAAVHGISTSVVGNTRGVEGWNASASDGAAGVSGEATAGSGAVRGVRGRTESTSDGAIGVFGKSEGASGNTAGVEGLNSSSTDRAAGVRGRSDASSGKTYGVAGSTDSGTEGAAGVAGQATNGRAVGVRGETSSSDARSAGVEAVSTSATTPALRVRGASGGRGLALDGSSDGVSDVFVNHAGIDLNSASDRTFMLSNSGGGGVELRVGTDKVLVEGDVSGGLTLPYDGESAADGQIFRVESTGTGGAGAFINSPVDPASAQSALFVWNEGESSGIYVNQVGDHKAIDIYSTSTSQPAVQINHSIDGVDALYVSGHAKVTKTFSAGSVTGDSPSGTFNNGLTVFGRTYVWGELDATSVSASIKAFRIDHPLKPETHYLSHSSIESWERLNLYTGLAQLDDTGSAWIDLPAWFEPLNTDFRYQLTAIGESMPGLFVSRSVEGSRFAIDGGVPGSQVSWQVTGVRQDPYALAHPLEVESAKEPENEGRYLTPQVFGRPNEEAIFAPEVNE